MDRESVRDLSFQNVLTGLLGRDILGSGSPHLHETEARAQGLELNYVLFDFAQRGWAEADLPRILDAAATLGFSGVNVTYPFKQAVMRHLDQLSDGARQVGAVNTVSFADGRMSGFNTDVIGFEESFRRDLADVSLEHVVQYGAGGAGSATAQALLSMGAGRLTLFDNERDRAEALARQLAQTFDSAIVEIGGDREASARTATGFVNATPLGMDNHPGSAVPLEWLEARHWVAEIVYFPLETLLLREARQRGCRTLDGSGMVVFQAAAAFDIFTGLRADRERMLASFIETIRKRGKGRQARLWSVANG